MRWPRNVTTERIMAIRLQELHPSLVHLPITLFPTAIGIDLVGRATGNDHLLETGRRAIGFAAVGAALSAITGLIAQEEVNVEGKTMDMLITHRNINLTATIMTALMTRWRSRRSKPSATYLALGLAGVGALTYSAYLGGKLVYHHGVGVAPAKGQYREHPPELRPGEMGEFSKDAATDLGHGVKHLTSELAQGKIVPSITEARAKAQPFRE
jgi:uncharacterized membrane protein